MSQTQDAADRARQRAFHRDRAIVKKIGREATAVAVDRMNEQMLWVMIQSYAKIAEQRAQSGRDIELARTTRDLRAAIVELYLRGHQLQLPGL